MLLKRLCLLSKKQSLSDYQIEEVLFLYSTNARLSSKISSMSLLQAGITKNRDFQTYIGLLKNICLNAMKF